LSLRGRFLWIMTLFLLALAALPTWIFWNVSQSLEDDKGKIIQDMDANTNTIVQQNLEELTSGISMQVTLMESEVERSMLNAALTVRQMDAQQTLGKGQLDTLRAQTKMSDLYLTDRTGKFVATTEDAARGLNLFTIWDGYRALVTGEAQTLPTPLTIKVETGEVFKFMAIPRADGKGVIESALNADVFNKVMENSLERNPAIRALYLVDASTRTVLMESLGKGQSALWEKGQLAQDKPFDAVAKSGTRQYTSRERQADLYAPVLVDGKTRYVLYALVDTTTMYSNTNVAEQSLGTFIRSISDAGQRSTLLIVGVVLLLMVTMGLASTRLIFRPLSRIADHARTIAEGDLTGADIPERRKDEIGDLSRSFNAMANNLRSLLAQVDDGAGQVSNSSEELAASSDQTRTAITEIATVLEEVADLSDGQYQNVRESATTITEMSLGIQDISQRAQSLSANAHQTSQEAMEGTRAIHVVTAGMKAVTQTVEELAERVGTLNHSSARIGDILATISNIASQTNLLSLNASIEAARAGDQGRGFAVVANEIRKLAEQTTLAVDQVAELVEMIKGEVGQVVESTMKGSAEIQAGIRTVGVAERSFLTIQGSVQGVATDLEEISDAVQELSESARLVVAVSEYAADVAQQVAGSTRAVAGATEEQRAMIEQVASSSESLAKLAEELTEQVRGFRVR
jgi:methyl-accepting chemotaxis protein